jgi:uncharacterized protein (TIGR02265 family)
MADRYIFAVAVEAFFVRAMAGRLDAPTRARLRAVGVAVDEPLLSVYPADVFHRGVALAAEAVYAAVPPEEAHYRAGRDHIDAFVHSYPGKMMAALARQIDPRTILEYTATFIRLGNNFTESRARPTAPQQVALWLNDVGGVPHFYRGVIHRGLEVADVKGVEVAVGPDTPPPGVTFDVRWTGR